MVAFALISHLCGGVGRAGTHTLIPWRWATVLQKVVFVSVKGSLVAKVALTTVCIRGIGIYTVYAHAKLVLAEFFQACFQAYELYFLFET